MPIRIDLTTEFQFKQTILTFWSKFAGKVYFQSKTDKRTAPLNSEYLNYNHVQNI